MNSVVYKIINLETGDFYIGSTYDINSRIRAHLYMLRKNIHHSVYLQNAWNKYGQNKFIFHVLEFVPENRLLELEQVYIDGLKPVYNTSKNSSSPMKDRKHSEKTRIKMSGKTPWNLGVNRTEEEKLLMSLGQKESFKRNPQRRELSRKIMKDIIQKNGGSTFKGKHHTEKNKKYFRELRKSKKRIICITTGEVFEAQIDAARKYKIKQGHISEVLNGKRASVRGYKFKYEEL